MLEASSPVQEAGLNAGVALGSCVSRVLGCWCRLDIVLAVQPQSLDDLDGVLLVLICVSVRGFEERS